MTHLHRVAPVALGVLLAAATLKLAACSAVDPNPPNPHLVPTDPSTDPLKADLPDGAAPDAADASDTGAP
jgi:hypothetical protein